MTTKGQIDKIVAVIIMSETIREQLFSMKDEEYKAFTAGLIPGAEAERIIGVRIPQLKKLAKKLISEDAASDFLTELPHYYFEENNLHSFIINGIKDVDVLCAELERFLPYVDNWATCDGIRPASFRKNADVLLPFVMNCLESEHEYTCRFGIEMLMTYYLDENFSLSFAERVAQIKSDKYYINMMIAWYFATALAKQWDSVIKIIEEKRLSPWVQNKTVSKANDSFRITTEQKVYLKTLRITEKRV